MPAAGFNESLFRFAADYPAGGRIAAAPIRPLAHTVTVDTALGVAHQARAGVILLGVAAHFTHANAAGNIVWRPRSFGERQSEEQCSHETRNFQQAAHFYALRQPHILG